MASWFEVRLVRFHFLTTTLRQNSEAGGSRSVPGREDQATSSMQVIAGLNPRWISSSESLTNLHIFDYGTSAGLLAEPY